MDHLRELTKMHTDFRLFIHATIMKHQVELDLHLLASNYTKRNELQKTANTLSKDIITAQLTK